MIAENAPPDKSPTTTNVNPPGNQGPAPAPADNAGPATTSLRERLLAKISAENGTETPGGPAPPVDPEARAAARRFLDELPAKARALDKDEVPATKPARAPKPRRASPPRQTSAGQDPAEEALWEEAHRGLAAVLRLEAPPASDGQETAAGEAPEPEPVHLTDLGAAVRLVRAHGTQLHYCHPWRTWLYWDGRRWHEDNVGVVDWLARQVIRQLFRDTAVELALLTLERRP